MRNQSKSLLNCVRSRDACNYLECCGNQVPCPSKHCSTPWHTWHTMNQFGHDLVMIWSWTTSNHRGSAFTASFDGCSSTNISCLNRRNNRDPLNDRFHMVLLDRNFLALWGFFSAIFTCWQGTTQKFLQQDGHSALITFRKRRLKLQVSNIHSAAIKIETTTTCPCDTEAVCESNKLVHPYLRRPRNTHSDHPSDS